MRVLGTWYGSAVRRRSQAETRRRSGLRSPSSGSPSVDPGSARPSELALRAHLLRRVPVAGFLAAALLVPGALGALPLLAPSVATAATCTISWDGGAGTSSWHTASNWDTNALPGASDVVCIGSGSAVDYVTGTTSVLAIQVDGTLTVSGGTLSLTSTTSPSHAGTLNLTGGNLGGAGSLGVSGSFTWNGGTMAGSGTTTIAEGGQLLLSSNGTRYLGTNASGNARSLVVEGSAAWSAGYLHAYAGSSITNGGSFTVDITSGATSTLTDQSSTGADPVFTNNGTLAKTGDGTFRVETDFNNTDGTRAASVAVSAGRLEIAGGGSATNGAFSVGGTSAIDDELRFGGDYALGLGSSIAGAGDVTFQAGTVNVDGAWTATGGIAASGGTGNLNATASATAISASRVDVTGGTLKLDRATTARDGSLTGGVISGSGALTISGSGSPTPTFTWNGGTMAGSGTTTIAEGGQLLLSSNGTRYLGTNASGNARSLVVEGSAAWSAGYLHAYAGSSITNGGSFTVDITSGATSTLTDQSSTGADPVFTNNGTLAKTGDGTFRVETDFNNGGTVEALFGTVNIADTFTNFNSGTKTLTGGSYVVQGTLRFNNADVVTNAAGIVLDGSASQILDNTSPGANALRNFVTNSAGGSFTIRNGRPFTSPSAFTNAGAMTVGSTSTFSITTGDYIQTDGSTKLSTLTSTLAANAAGAKVDIQGGHLSGIGIVQPALRNAGEVRPGNSAGVLRVNGDYTQASGGTLRVEIGGTASGSGYDQLQVLTGTATIDGTVVAETITGFLPASGTEYEIVAGNRTGEFSIVQGRDFAPRRFYTVLYDQSDNVRLRALSYHTVTVTKSVTGSATGSVTSSPTGISCDPTCEYDEFVWGDEVTLTATAGDHAVFQGWGGDCSGSSTTCTLTINSDVAVSAPFGPDSHTLTVNKTVTGAASGTVTSTPAGIDCGTDCTESYTHGTLVTLTATPASGSTFGGWSGEGCTGTGTCEVRMELARSVSAQFSEVDVAPPSGTVSINQNRPYTNKTAVTLTLSATDPSPASGVTHMRLSNDGVNWPLGWEAYATSRSWTIPSGDGAKKVYAQFRDAVGQASTIVYDTITLDTVKPTVTAPAQTFVASSQVKTSVSPPTVFVRLTWVGKDSRSGILRYELQWSVNTGAYKALPLSPAYASAKNLSLASGKNTYRFRVRAVDRAGNVSLFSVGPVFKIVPYQESATIADATGTKIAYSGIWRGESVSVAYGGRQIYTKAAGARATFTFRGRNVAFVSTIGPGRGKVEIWLDGVKQTATPLDLYSPTLQYRKLVFTKAVSPSVLHTLQVRVLGTAGRPRADVDAFLVAR